MIILNVADDFCPVDVEQTECKTIKELFMKESNSILPSTLEKLKKENINARFIVEFGLTAETIIDFAERERLTRLL